MIADTLARYAPDSPLASQHCVSVLRDVLHFPDAAWISYAKGDQGRPSDMTQILVVEPRDSARVRLRPTLTDTIPVPAEWVEAQALVAQSPAAVEYLLRQAWLLSDSAVDSPALQRSPTGIHLASFARSQRSPEAYTIAQTVLHRDARLPLRLLALIVLAAAPEREATWQTLAIVLRDPDLIMRVMSPQLLGSLSTFYPRPVDWSPVADDVAAILDGTNLWAFGPMLRALNHTAIDPHLATPLLQPGAGTLLAALASIDAPTRGGAHAVLERLAGRDLGSREADWVPWIAGLQATRRAP